MQNGDEYVLDCPDIADEFKEYDFTMAAMKNFKDSNKAEFKLID